MRFELIGNSNLNNEIKGNVSRQLKAFGNSALLHWLVSELLDTPVNVSLPNNPSQTRAGYLTGQDFANVYEHLSPRDQPFGFNRVKSKLEYTANIPFTNHLVLWLRYM